ncbi:hypothetical protein BH23CHL8_BH23CHL8_15810 [soil metagenome]
MPPPDPWTAFLEWLTNVLVPDWGGLIGLLPFLIIAGLVGPILTLVMLMWLWHLLHRRRGRIHLEEVHAVPAPVGEDGRPSFPVNVPYCEEHALLYPAREKHCQVDGTGLQVSCPVDGTVRAAEFQTCPACGTRFVLGATSASLMVASRSGPPEGGAAAA